VHRSEQNVPNDRRNAGEILVGRDVRQLQA
jgi:hypothetical protein